MWIEDHPYLAGGVALGGVVLWMLTRSSSSAAATTTAVSTGPSDSLQAQAIAAGASVQQAQITANAQVQQYNAQLAAAQMQANSTDLQTMTAGQVAVQTAQIQAGVTNQQTAAALQLGIVTAQQTTAQNNTNTQANLTLGLAGQGQSTQSVLELLAAQPGANPAQFHWLIGGTNPTTAPATTTTVTTTPTNNNANNSGSTDSTAPSDPYTTSGGVYVPPFPSYLTQPATVAAANPSTAAAQLAAASPSFDPSSPDYVVPVTGNQAAIAYDPALYETVQGDIAGGGTYSPNPQYYATPDAATQLATTLGLQQGSVTPGNVGLAGGPFTQPQAAAVYVSQGAPTATGAGYVDTGQILSGLQNTAPGTWATQLAGYGVTLTQAQMDAIYQGFGNQQAVPANITYGTDPMGGDPNGVCNNLMPWNCSYTPQQNTAPVSSSGNGGGGNYSSGVCNDLEPWNCSYPVAGD